MIKKEKQTFLYRAAEPERRSWAFCLEMELKLKIRSRSRSRSRSSVQNLGLEPELRLSAR